VGTVLAGGERGRRRRTRRTSRSDRDVTARARRARGASATCQWSTARAELQRALEKDALGPGELSLLAMCEWWLGDVPACVTRAEEAFQAQLAAGQVEDAARRPPPGPDQLHRRGDRARVGLVRSHPVRAG